MLRALVVILLLANLVMLAWERGLLDGLTGPRGDRDREPERLQRQVHPERLRILPAQAASTALAAGAAASAASAAEAAASANDAPASSAAAVASAAAAATTYCLEAGPFVAAEATAAERTLRDAKLPPEAWSAQTSQRKGSFVIYMGRYADRDALQRKLDELRRMKIDAEEMRNAPELAPGLSLGRFDDAKAAETELARLAQRGLKTAKVITITPALPQVVLRAPAADAALRARLVALKMPSGPGFVACPAAPVKP
jgi:hypothetical protein